MNRIDSMLGLSKRAGFVQSGLSLTRESVRTGRAKLVVLAKDARKNSAKTIRDACSYYGVPLWVYGTKESLAHAIGEEERSCLCVCEEGLAKRIEELLAREVPLEEI